MKKLSFSEFEKVKESEWIEKIKIDLKGRDFDKTLYSSPEEELKIRAFFDRSFSKEHAEYFQKLPLHTENRSNKSAQLFDANSADFKSELEKAIQNNIKTILVKNYSSKIYDFLNGFPEITFVVFVNLSELPKIEKNTFTQKNIQLAIEVFQEDSIISAKIIDSLISQNTNFSLVINAAKFGDNGAFISQQLALAFSKTTEFFHLLTENQIPLEKIISRLIFTFSISSNFFAEIAKLRAFRLLWQTFISKYSISEHSFSPKTLSFTGKFNKSTLDEYTNLLRSTTETLAAIFGTSDLVCPLNYDFLSASENTFANRMARNQLHLLLEESFAGKVTDPFAGAYFVEELTMKIAEKAWKQFVELEKSGGFLENFQNQTIQEMLEIAASKQILALAKRKKTMIGVNEFPNLLNLNEKIAQNTQIPHISKNFEQIRKQTADFSEQHGKFPKVFLATLGNIKMRRARAAFSLNFFGLAGFEIIDNVGFGSVDECVNALKENPSEIIVFCAADEDYFELGSEFFEKVKNTHPSTVQVIAGRPKNNLEKLETIGFRNFIYYGMNLTEELEKYQNLIFEK